MSWMPSIRDGLRFHAMEKRLAELSDEAEANKGLAGEVKRLKERVEILATKVEALGGRINEVSRKLPGASPAP
jgi:hypothetical protein